MGDIKQVLIEKEVPTPEFNQRMTVELCENVHLHYRNLRLEFSSREFIELCTLLRQVDLVKVREFEYNPDKFKCLVHYNNLMPETEFDKRLQIEEQVGGGYHVHYRNLRIEVRDLKELGIESNTKTT